MTNLPRAIALDVGDSFGCAITTDRRIYCWGRNQFGQLGIGTTSDSPTPVQVGGITSAALLAAGSAHTCVGLLDGTIWCWGKNGAGQLGNGRYADASTPVKVQVPGVRNVSWVATRFGHTCATFADGALYCWGANASCQLGDDSTCGSPLPLRPAGAGTAHTMTTGADHTCITLRDGSVQCWGLNSFGELGSMG